MSIGAVISDGNDVELTQLTNNTTNRPALGIQSISPNSVRMRWLTNPHRLSPPDERQSFQRYLGV